jgi:SAM-dependent methyltransferase
MSLTNFPENQQTEIGPPETPDPCEGLAPLMRAKGVVIPPQEFQALVNSVLHRFESKSYDQRHRDMAQSLPRQFELFIDDYLRRYLPRPGMTVLDVGCGTGLSSELLLRTRLRSYIGRIDLLDPSPEMLEMCRQRRTLETVPCRTVCGTVHDLPIQPPYDFILACSVLHHIPDLGAFARAAAAQQVAGGTFLHLQDSNADYFDDQERLERVRQWQRSQPLSLRRALKGLRRLRSHARIRRKTWGSIEETNRELFRLQTIREPMTAEELWSVTDFHEHHGRGISISAMGERLPEYERISRRSYAFWGVLESDLPWPLRRMERELIRFKAQNGCRAGGLWARRNYAMV